MTVSLIDVSTYLPGEPVPAEHYAQYAESDELRDNLMFRAPRYRHHVAADETAIDMVERAAAGLLDRHGPDALADVDVSDHPHPDARHAVLRRRWRDGAPAGHETQLGDRPAQRWLRGIRARPEDGGAICSRVGRAAPR